MAPIFYCKCSNCVCKATVLVTKYEKVNASEEVKSVPEDMFGITTQEIEDVLGTTTNASYDLQNKKQSLIITASNSTKPGIESLFTFVLLILIFIFCWKLYTGINKTLASGKTSSFGLAKEIGEVEVGFNCYVKNRNEKRSESYFDDDFSNFFSSFGVGEDRNQPRHKQMGNYNSRFNSMPALMQII